MTTEASAGGEREVCHSGKRPGRELDWLSALAWMVQKVGRVASLRRALLGAAERAMRAHCARPEASLRHLPAVTQDRLAMALAVLEATERAFAERPRARPRFAGSSRYSSPTT